MNFLGKSKKRGLTGYREFTWMSTHAWNLMILCIIAARGMTSMIMVHLLFYLIPMLIYNVVYHGTSKTKGTLI